MLVWFEYLVVAYIGFGTVVYVYGHPKILKNLKTKSLENSEDEKHPITASNGIIERYSAHAAQMVNFIIHRVFTASKGTYQRSKNLTLENAYRISVEQAFKRGNFFITTGAPHSRALFLRNFAWFYPTLLDPENILDETDARRRLVILTRSLSIVLQTMGSIPYTTTLVPLSPKRLAAVNYVKQPSDSLLGILSGIDMLVNAESDKSHNLDRLMEDARKEGLSLLEKNSQHLQNQIKHLTGSLTPFSYKDTTTLLIDRDDNKSSATDTRFEKRRFVTNANVWATLNKAIQLNLVSEDDVTKALGRTLEQYKLELLSVFGSSGVITNSLTDHDSGKDNIVLDFAHTHKGFWTFSSKKEIDLFKSTADAIINDPTFRDDSGNCFFVSAENPKIKQFQHFVAASYHGRTVWPAFNVGFADRVIDLSIKTDKSYRPETVTAILKQTETYILSNDSYPEVLNPNGKPYSTWVYRSAQANSWFPYFISVKERAEKYINGRTSRPGRRK